MKHQFRRLWWATALILLGLSIGWAVWYVLQTADTEQPASLVPVRVSLDFFPNPNHVPLYVAIEQGFFAREGLRVEVFVPANPSDPVKLAAAKSVEIALTPQINYLIARSERLPLIAIGALINQPLGGLVALRSSGTATLAHLSQGKIGYALAPLEPVLWETVFACDGIDPSELTWVNVGYNTVAALISGHVDAIGVFRNYELIQLEQMGHAVVFFPQEDHCVPMTYELILISHPSFVDDHLETASAFMRAFSKGIEWTLAHPQQAAALFFQRFPDLEDDLNQRSFELTLPLYAPGAFHAEPSVWSTLQSYLVSRELMSDHLPPSTLYTEQALTSF